MNLSTVPTGLLGMLGIKNDGSYPSNLSGSYAPVLEMLEWLAASNCAEFISDGPAAFATIGQKRCTNGLWTVPSGQCWLLRGAVGSAGTAAGELLVGKIAVARVSGAAVLAHTGSDYATTSIAGAVGVGGFRAYLNGPIVMVPGDELIVDVTQVTSAAMAVFLQGYVYRFPY